MTTDTLAMKDGDVFTWAWRDGVRLNADPYHCWSRIAVVGPDGRLRDTFWSDNSDKLVPIASVVLTYRGNTKEMKKIPHYEAQFYRDKDVVDMRHSNNSHAPVYVVPGAERDQGVMRDVTLERLAKARREMEYQKKLIGVLSDELADIEAGLLANVIPR